jgi:XTP/dITP diphosphohydrolase
MPVQKLLFATSNVHKLEEIRALVPQSFEIIGLKDVGFDEAIPETGQTFEENALLKSRYLHRLFGGNVFSDDSGIEVEALEGRPGVFSARFAGEGASDAQNCSKLLDEMHSESNRKARFVAVISLIYNNIEYSFKGEVRGRIAASPIGKNGFGYDPVFIPDGFDKTFGELPSAIKNRLSHRAVAVRKLVDFLSA